MKTIISKTLSIIITCVLSVFVLFATVNIGQEGKITFILEGIASEGPKTTQPAVVVELPGTTTDCTNCWCTTRGTQRTSCLNIATERCVNGLDDYSYTFRDPKCR